jgi:thymidylate synthase ThyX
MTQSTRDIFAIVGLPPEVLAVAMAKYSRSKESIKTTIDELTEEKSAEFHEKWVIGYGDASVADMAMIAVALENVSILASKAIEDNRLASYQEKSTRYVDFDSTRYYRPATVMVEHGQLYEATIDNLFAAYHSLHAQVMKHLARKFVKPAEITDKAYEAKIKARSLDAARYILPVATLTNLGMIMSARSMRRAISKMMGSDYPEIREIAEAVKQAALSAAYNPQLKKAEPFLAKLKDSGPDGQSLADEFSKLSSLQVKGAPTLIKHTEPSAYLTDTPAVLNKYVKEIFGEAKPIDSPRVDFIPPHSPEDELVSTLLYSACTLPYRQILTVVADLPAAKKEEIIDAVSELRSQFEQPRREYEVGSLTFDVLMDYGAFRDLQRHRLCTQINQPLVVDHGYEIPPEIEWAGITAEFEATISKTMEVYHQLRKAVGAEADYLIPLAFKKRTLFKMNLRELYHMVELRSKPGGHMSYRTIVLDMYEAVKKSHPLLVKHLRAVTPNYEEDFFKR